VIARLIFVVLIVPFLRAWPRLFVWLESLIQRSRARSDQE
jgi:hypothetical protein